MTEKNDDVPKAVEGLSRAEKSRFFDVSGFVDVGVGRQPSVIADATSRNDV